LSRDWSQGADACDASGEAVPLTSERAAAWSLIRAFALSATDGVPTDHVPAALRALADVTQADSFRDWSDHPLRTHEHVVDALNAAISDRRHALVNASEVRRNQHIFSEVNKRIAHVIDERRRGRAISFVSAGQRKTRAALRPDDGPINSR
jgi:hypothetical protein